MLQRKLLMRTLSVLLSASLCYPVMAVDTAAAKSKSQSRTAVELQMQADGSIRGKVVDRQGKSIANAPVKVVNRIGSAVAKTDANGMFAVQGISVGEYVIGIGSGSQKVRVWNAQTAPPKTAQLALLVVGDTVRGQCCGDSCDGCSTCAAPAPSCGAPAGDCCAAAAPSCGAPAGDCCDGAGPSCGAPSCSAPTCGVPSPVCSPCDSIISSCGPSCGGCDSCGGGCGLFGGGAGLFGGGGGVLSGGGGPILIGGAVASAIAIPLALDDDDDAS